MIRVLSPTATVRGALLASLKCLLVWISFLGFSAHAAGEAAQYRVGPGDLLRIAVYQSPDLSVEIRVGEAGDASYPLLGTIRVGGLTVTQAEQYMVNALKSGGYLKNPQVMVTVLQVRANFVNVLGQVSKPGRYPLDIAGIRLTEVLALAGGLSPEASELLQVTGVRNGAAISLQIDMPSLFGPNGREADLVMQPGDSIWVDRAPVGYVYGEVNRPGNLRLMRDMTVMQALAASGGVTTRGTTKGMKLNRRDGKTGKTISLDPAMDDRLQDGDVLYVRESLF
jgi:polysaccharide export outer membrane protein